MVGTYVWPDFGSRSPWGSIFFPNEPSVRLDSERSDVGQTFRPTSRGRPNPRGHLLGGQVKREALANVKLQQDNDAILEEVLSAWRDGLRESPCHSGTICKVQKRY